MDGGCGGGGGVELGDTTQCIFASEKIGSVVALLLKFVSFSSFSFCFSFFFQFISALAIAGTCQLRSHTRAYRAFTQSAHRACFM